MTYRVRISAGDGGALEVTVDLCGPRYRAALPAPGSGWAELAPSGAPPPDPRVLITSDLLDDEGRARLERVLQGPRRED